MTDTCAHEGCSHKAEWAIECHIPAKGWAIEAHRPLTIICDLAPCRDHAATEDLLAMIPDLRDAIKAVLSASGLAAPDFDRAWTTPLRRSHPRFLEFEREQAAQKRVGGGNG